MPGHIADHEGHPGAGQFDHGEPVTAHAVLHVGRHMVRGDLDGGTASHVVGEQVAFRRGVAWRVPWLGGRSAQF
ncbi:hypothetical protein GCM10010521_02390 [Streptomyces rameus]|uniref:Uncharacterized protein n=1 Tax=Streptomyces rameus TaxID=68261 RepID=A0ABP6MR60_9ACTN